MSSPKIAVVIPTYKVKSQILRVIQEIPDIVQRIYVVDDCCPQNSGNFVAENSKDARVVVAYNPVNLGVGGAVMTGYRLAVQDGMDIVVKIDGDGQMDPGLVSNFADPIINGLADYTKGNRFFNLEFIATMPRIRVFGNAALSFLNKLSSGYWNLFDPTNGYTAIHTSLIQFLPFDKISNRYFFESDMLFRLNTLQAVVYDIPMIAKYEDEVSNLSVSKATSEFAIKHSKNFFKRIFYNYYLRDLSIASIELPAGIALVLFGIVFGLSRWIIGVNEGVANPAGTVMLAAIPVLLGTQFLLSFFGYDIQTVPKIPVHKRLTALRLAPQIKIENDKQVANLS